MSAINCTIGKWWPESIEFKKQLSDFMLGEWKKKIPQRGSIGHVEHGVNHSRMWEYSTALAFTNPQKHQNILDVGGVNNLLGWFLHNRIGCFVTQVGINEIDEINFKKNCEPEQRLTINCLTEDIRNLSYDKDFEIVYCISVLEHVREDAREEKNKKFRRGKEAFWKTIPKNEEEYEETREKLFIESLARAVRPGGILCITFDYKKHGNWRAQYRGAYLRNTKDIYKRIVEPSKMKIIGNMDYETIYPAELKPPTSTGIVFLRK
jgi:SAM-dependent methyltransferase